MTIKQQGGIFGRNPTFNSVEVENDLTVDGTLTHNGTQDITGQLNVDNLRLDGNTVSSTNTNGNIVLDPNGSGNVTVDAPLTTNGSIEVREFDNATINITATAFTINDTQVYGSLYFVSEDGSLESGRKVVAGVQAINRGGAGSFAALDFYRSGNTSAATTVKGIRLDYDGNTIFYQDDGVTEAARITKTGNFVPISGAGIDFSATAGTGTSELFDDYEEGTWTPTQGNFGTWTDPVFAATYTKIGRSVTINVRQNSGTIASGGANKYISGLPYAPALAGSTGVAINGSGLTVSDLLLYSDGNIYFISDTGSQTSVQFALTYMV